MLPRLTGVTAFMLTISAVAGLTPATSADVRTLPMQFEVLQEGPTSICGEKCRTFISAVGAITRDTPGDFAAFAKKHELSDAVMVLDSSGGSVLGTLSLGRSIRRLAINTTVGKLTKFPRVGPDKGRAALSPRADCESMCAFLLLAGKQRFVPPEAKVLVHEIWLGDRREDAAAATYSAEDIVVVQRDIGRLAQYTVEMGGSIDLLETSLRIPPWEPMRRLAPSELRAMGLDMSDGLYNTGSQPRATSVSSPRAPRMPPNERGWVANDKAGQPSLRRRHPLTIEGDEIGSFELVLTCAGNDTYNVTYTERRRGAAAPLKQVAISVGRRTVPLKLVSSELRESEELSTLARGVVSASLIESFARQRTRSMTVTTAGGNDVSTMIRVGNTGVAQNLPRLAANCADQPAQPELHVGVVPAPAKAAEAGNDAAAAK